MALPGFRLYRGQGRPRIPAGGPSHFAAGLQKYAGVECFERRFCPIQPSDSDCLCRRNAAHVATWGVKPPAECVRPLECPLDTLTQLQKLREPLPCRLLRMRSPNPPALKRAAARAECLGEFVLRETHSLFQGIECLARSSFEERRRKRVHVALPSLGWSPPRFCQPKFSSRTLPEQKWVPSARLLPTPAQP